ncbi:cyclic nucleotide-binding domain-containing protein [Intrasporangium sp.]|uniref:Crp/Fnr family transcriptional regulator n=1 Tax=Intrasporangium sp. TaxID=1925024 RepID=UPI00293AD224|nr:cyclic nucleotide-binding domain-containing protein [Intrasporangium sp.]MDV3222252.1 cyclic nucleotide-binding domain-containing protein [Intrasporangium sp.]
MTLRAFLRHEDLFSDVPDDVLDTVIERGSEQQVPAGRVLVQQGQSGGGLHLVLEGSAVVTVDDTEVATLGPGDYFGEMSLIDRAPHSATVSSGPSGVTTFILSPVTFQGLLDLSPHCDRVLLKILTRRVRRLEEALRADAP